MVRALAFRTARLRERTLTLASIAPRAALVINGSQDRLFALDGVQAAFDKIAQCYATAGARDRQRCRLYDAPHEFNLSMQAEAWEWLRRWV